MLTIFSNFKQKRNPSVFFFRKPAFSLAVTHTVLLSQTSSPAPTSLGCRDSLPPSRPARSCLGLSARAVLAAVPWRTCPLPGLGLAAAFSARLSACSLALNLRWLYFTYPFSVALVSVLASQPRGAEILFVLLTVVLSALRAVQACGERTLARGLAT